MLNSQDYFDKRLRRLGKELRQLWRRRYIRVELREPIQCGWVRFQVLAPKAQTRSDKDVLLSLLKVIGTLQYRNSPDFRKRRGRGRWKRFVEVEQPLRILTVGEWDRLRLPEKWKSYFRQEKQCYFRTWHDSLVFAGPQVFELRVEPNWITETWIPDPAVERRSAEIETWVWHRNAMHRLNRWCGHSDHWCDSGRDKLLAKVARRELREAMHNLPEVDPGAPTRRIRISFRLHFLFPRRSPTSRDTPLRPEPVRVQLLPPGPHSNSFAPEFAPAAQRRDAFHGVIYQTMSVSRAVDRGDTKISRSYS